MPESKLSRADEIEMRWKELQIEDMEEKIANRRDLKKRLEDDRKRQWDDFVKSQQVKAHRQHICKHRKGGKDNKFWNGNSQDYSINKNTFPTGLEVIFCTRCGKELQKPDRALKKTDPKLFATMVEEWKLWSSFPTDNTPSGSRIFEIISDAAA